MIFPQDVTLFATLTGVTVVILLMFLPALLELRKPQDAGPRFIAESFMPIKTNNSPPILVDIEGEARIIMTYARFIHFLPNLESAIP